MSITNWGKAIDVLRYGGFDVASMKEGDAKPYTIDEQVINSIIADDEYNPLRVLNKAGQLLKKSTFTRLTNDKKHDFSVLQSTSNLLYQNYVSKLYDITKSKTNDKRIKVQFTEKDIKTIENAVKKEAWLVKEAIRELEKAKDVAKKEKCYQDELKELIGSTEPAQKLAMDNFFKILYDGGLDQNIKSFTETQKQTDSGKAGKVIKVVLAGVGVVVVVGVAAAVAPELVVPAAVGGAIGFSIGFIIGLPIALAVIYAKSKTASKRIRIEAQDHLARAVKRFNAFEKHVQSVLIKVVAKNLETGENTQEYSQIIEATQKYLVDQKKNWEPYVSYPQKNRLGYHGDLQKLKLALAKQYCNMTVDPRLL